MTPTASLTAACPASQLFGSRRAPGLTQRVSPRRSSASARADVCRNPTILKKICNRDEACSHHYATISILRCTSISATLMSSTASTATHVSGESSVGFISASAGKDVFRDFCEQPSGH